MARKARPRALVCFCCQGGEAAGYVRAGWDVHGVDNVPQPRFPFRFTQADAVQYVRDHGHEYDMIVGGPPCQRYSKAQRIQGREHPDLIEPFRDACLDTDLPYVIENVEEARPELFDPILLCGVSFGLKTDRHRLFESNVPLVALPHPVHPDGKTKMGRPFREGSLRQYVGNFSGVQAARDDLDVQWMNRDGIRECIQPAYAEYLGRQLLRFVS